MMMMMMMLMMMLMMMMMMINSDDCSLQHAVMSSFPNDVFLACDMAANRDYPHLGGEVLKPLNDWRADRRLASPAGAAGLWAGLPAMRLCHMATSSDAILYLFHQVNSHLRARAAHARVKGGLLQRPGGIE
eukprot:3102824-Amphidinium_carterae.1